MRNGRGPVASWSTGAPWRRTTTSAAEGYALATILHGLARPNVVVADMLALGLVNASGTWLGDELANAADVVAGPPRGSTRKPAASPSASAKPGC